MHNETPALLAVTVDRLALIKAQVAALQTEEQALKQILADSGKTVILGTTHRATVSHCDGKTTTDWQSVAMRLNPSRQLIAAHTSVGDPYTAVRLSAHKTSK